MESPTNGELKIMLNNLEEKQVEKHRDIMESLREIKFDVKETMNQAKATNGRVNRHDMYFKIFWWSLGALGSFTLFSFPYLRQIVQIETRDSVNAAVSSAMRPYDDKINQTVQESIGAALAQYDIKVTQ